MLEIWTGSDRERKAQADAKKLGSKVKLSPQQQKEYNQARARIKGLYTRRVVIGGAGTLVVGAAGVLAMGNIDRDPYFESAYNQYMTDFEALAKGDKEGETLLSFFKERRKRGYIQRGIIIADESGDSKANFYTAISERGKDGLLYDQMAGFAVFKHNENPPQLILKRTPIDPLWSGALIAHEALHVYQRLTGYEQSREDGFIIGEQEAYALEFRLINRALDGRFMKTLKEQAKEIRPESYRGRLSTNNMNAISALFRPARSVDEEGLRLGAYIIAINFAAIEDRFQGANVIKAEQVNYMRQVIGGSIPLIS